MLIVGENEPQNAELLRGEEAAGAGFDALWNDDFHHSAMVCLTGKREAYYTDYTGKAEELIAAVKWSYLFQGQRYSWQKKTRGTPAFDLPAPKFINYIQNHDQLANSARGQRIHQLTSPGRLRAMTALLLLAPQTPLLFQGQEFAASSPFLYFNDCQGEEAARVAQRASQVFEPISLSGDRRNAGPTDRSVRSARASSDRSSIFPIARRMPTSTPCIAIC